MHDSKVEITAFAEKVDTSSKGSSSRIDDDDSIEEELLFGYGRFTPSWMQWMHNAKWLLWWLGCAAFVNSFVVNAIFPTDLSTLERQYSMSSVHTGIVSSMYDIAVMLVVFPICHWGRNIHKGRWIGWGGLVMAAGSFVCSLPHFIVQPYDPSKVAVGNMSDFGQCDGSWEFSRKAEEATCSSTTPSALSAYINPYFLLFLLGQALHGAGSTPLFSIGTAYIDENVSQNASPFYLAIHGIMTALGPAFGLFVGGFLLDYYVDVDRVNAPPIGQKDPRWLGAWWIGFLISGVAALAASVPVLGFARELPEAKEHRIKDVNQAHAVSQNVAEEIERDGGNMNSIKATARIIFGIVRNPTFLIICVIGIPEAVIVNGFSAFMPKIIETVLNVSPTNASFMCSVVIFAAATGLLLGGSIMKFMKLQVPGMFKMLIVLNIGAVLFLATFLVQCPPRTFMGITVNYDGQAEPSLNATCNGDCACTDEWNPVCDDVTNTMYFSACYAGCKTRIGDESKGNLKWTDCSCLGSEKRILRSGHCSTNCGGNVYIFMMLLYFLVTLTFAGAIPMQQLLLRIVPFDQRTLAIGVNWTLLKLFGFIPGGIIFGWIIDKSCINWATKCGVETSCHLYNPTRLSQLMLALSVVCKLAVILASILGLMTYTPTEMDDVASMATVNSHGALSLMVNDDRLPNEQARDNGRY